MSEDNARVENFLLIGLGAVAIQFAFDLRKVTEGKLGFMNRPGSRSRLVREAIEAGHPFRWTDRDARLAKR